MKFSMIVDCHNRNFVVEFQVCSATVNSTRVDKSFYRGVVSHPLARLFMEEKLAAVPHVECIHQSGEDSGYGGSFGQTIIMNYFDYVIELCRDRDV